MIEQLIDLCYTFAYRITQNHGFSIILLSFIVSSLILPLYMIAEKLQQTERDKQSQMKRTKDKINAVFKGDKRYMMLSTLYRQHKYHPVYALRSSFGLLIQVPFFIAAYRYLSHLDILNGQSFLFIKDLGAPDGLLFSGINLLPVIMTLINAISGAIYTKGLSRQEKIQVYALSAIFLLLLYNSPAALVFYWTCNNIYNLVKNILIKEKNADKGFYLVTLILGAGLIISIVLFHEDQFIRSLLNILLILLILSAPLWQRLYNFLRLKLNEFIATENPKIIKSLFCIISVLPPNIFIFHLLSKNVDYVYYSHVLIVAMAFSIIAFLLYLTVSFIGKSSQGSAWACFFLWMVFFTIIPLLFQNFLFNYIAELRLRYHMLIFSILLIPIFILAAVIFKLSCRIRKTIYIKYSFLLLTIIFLFNFIQSTIIYISENTYKSAEINFKTSFLVDTDTPSPNIYWLFMDSMLGFKAMEYFFDDTQLAFEGQLNERGFIVKRDAEFECGFFTGRAIPALMSPFYYDTVMAPVLASDPIDYTRKKGFPNITSYSIFKISSQSYFTARLNNELIASFKAKGYQTITVASPGYYWLPITEAFYTSNGKIDYDAANFQKFELFDKLNNLNELLGDATPLYIFKEEIMNKLSRIYTRPLNIKPIHKSDIDKTIIYGDYYKGNDMWHIDTLSDIFKSRQPRITILTDMKAHYSFTLAEDGSGISRTAQERYDIYNYPPQHRYTSKYLINLIDFILENDPDAIIVIQADHGLHHDNSRTQILSSGGTADEVSLIYNQVMNAVRIPDKWGGLVTPLDPLDISRLLINRFVGQNYELLY